jgi:protein-disulfide isomerase
VNAWFEDDVPRLTLPVGPRDHRIGSDDAPVELVEYGDYECPFCAAAHPTMRRLLRLEGDRVLFVFRHFPMANVHPHAELAAEAAEAAGAQGAFWAMHDLLLTNQGRLEVDDLILYATELELDVGRFARELTARVHQPKVREDFLSGVRSGVNGTPTFFINGLRYDGPRNLETMLSIVRRVAA